MMVVITIVMGMMTVNPGRAYTLNPKPGNARLFAHGGLGPPMVAAL